jgi:predicted nucleotidyltransferase component of viral defense system
MKINFNQSLKDRLKNLAKAADRDYNYVCIQFMQERFLARLQKTEYRNHFILKGALLLLAYDLPGTRPSKDIDFLGTNIPNNTKEIRSAIGQITGIDLDDGVKFYSNQMEIEEITRDADYLGSRIKLNASVGGDKHRLQIDIGFGDVIAHGPVKLSYPALLDYEPPQILAYSLETAIAEKLQAIVSLGHFGSRMKDFYDVWFLTKHRTFETGRLAKAIKLTFSRRDTAISDINNIFKHDFIQDINKARQWKAFLRRAAIPQEVSFEDIMLDLKAYFEEII